MKIPIPSKALSAEIELKLRRYGRYITFLRRHPTHAARSTLGIVVPPHESSMLELAWMGYKDNIYQCSRGTSKTFTLGSLFSPMRSSLFRNANILLASASRFRGGKLIMRDGSRLLDGHLASQRLPGRWLVKSISHPKTLKKDPDMWSIEFASNSLVFTVPTNNEEALRGIRTTITVFDERNNFEKDIIDRIFDPFAIVGTDFASPAQGTERNQTFNVGTIDYSYRGWYDEIMTTQDLAKIQYLIQKALMAQDWSTYHDLMSQHGKRLYDASFSYVRYDYTDLLIPVRMGKYKINYPGAVEGKSIKWDNRDNCSYVYTYPVDKQKIEYKIDEGLADKDSWEAEHRNMFIMATGSVYNPTLIEKVTGPIYTQIEEDKRGWDRENKGSRYTAPILYTSDDPCIIGVDVARTAAFTAVVVIRVGYAPDLYFNSKHQYELATHSGMADWANVIWAEQHQHMTSKDTAELIRELRKRYNIVTTKELPGIIMDSRGGGVHVRDELANPSPPVDNSGTQVLGWKCPQRIYDPEDAEFKHLLVQADAWSGLKLLTTTDVMNQELVSFSRAQMETGRLYIAPYKAQRERSKDNELLTPGFLGVRVLKHQLLRIQAIPTAAGKSIRYVMPGDKDRPENQKDMLFAFLYACYGLRQWHYEALRLQQRKGIPTAYGVVVRLPGTTTR